VDFEAELEALASFTTTERLEQLKKHIAPEWIEEALGWAGVVTMRRRRLPAEQVVWLVIGMALFRDSPMERIVDALELALPNRDGTVVARSAIPKARARLKEDPLAYLFAVTAAEWATRSAAEHRWRGLALYGLDGTTLRVPDSAENRAEFGGQKAGGGRGESGYPQVRVAALMAVRSHVLSAFRFADYHTGETTLARGVWAEVPENSLVIIDRNFLVKKDLIDLETSGNRHWLSRSKVNSTWAIRETLGPNDYLVEWEVHGAGLPTTWTARAIRYKKKGHPESTLLTSLLDPAAYPAKELVELYHERWETEIGYDELKTHMLERRESIRSRSPAGVRQELWGIAIAYNLVRVEMERIAHEAKVPPTRISFTAAIAMIRDELRWFASPRPTASSFPSCLAKMRERMKRFILPPRRPERSAPRAVKVKMSNYPRKRPSTRPVK
jgi:hypothetical protein